MGALSARLLPRGPAAQAIVVAVGVAVATAETHELGRGGRALAASDEALAAHDLPAAIQHAAEAAEARAPGSPYPERGFDHLARIGREAEDHGDFASAAEAWHAARRAASTARTLGGAEVARRDEAEAALARLAARDATQKDPTAVPGVTSDAALATLRADDRPPLGQLVLLGLGAVALFGGAAAALGEGGSVRLRRAATLAAAVGLALLALACAR